MEYFSEIYGCYYKIISQILKQADMDAVTRQEIIDITTHLGFGESGLTIPHKLFSGEWPFLEKTETGNYGSLLSYPPQMPLTLLQKRWLKSLLSDKRIGLFLDDAALAESLEVLSEVEPLWSEEQFYYYDRYEKGDDFSSKEYRQNFRLVVNAIREGKVLNFDYISAKGKYTRKACLPVKIEYSPKNDRFRLIGLRCPFGKRFIMDRYRFDGIRNTVISDSYPDGEVIKKAASKSLAHLMRRSYDTEPVRLLIHNRRNALERTMLHFANYDKDTKQLDEDTWECCIYYDSSMETELLIEILSFGPVVLVVGPDAFVELIRERLRKQSELLLPKAR